MLSLYRALLWLYPASYRREYEAELLDTFTQLSGERGSLTASLAAVADVVPNALLAHGAILLHDLRYAARTLKRSRGFALTVVLVTALGVGANTATFSVADLVLLRPLPFPDPNSLVRLCEGPREGGGWGCMNELSPANFRDVAMMSRSTWGWGVFTGNAVNLVGTGEPTRIRAESVSPAVLPLLGVPPVRGRLFDSTSAAEFDTATVIIGYDLWRSYFGGDEGVIGTTVRLNGVPRVVIGVMPAGFHFPTRDVQMWLPLALGESDFLDRTNTYLQAIGRLKPGVGFEQARSEIAQIASRLGQAYPETNEETGFSFFRQRDNMSPRYRLMLQALCAASVCLLLLTGANLANLLLVRAAGRETELAIRAALGAGRDRLVRQMLTESLLLAAIGGVVGAAVAVLAIPLLASLVPASLPLADRPQLDLRVLFIGATFTVVTGIGFGLIPAFRAGGQTGFDALREGTRAGAGRRHRLRRALVAIEVAVSMVLLIGAGLLLRAMLRVEAVNPGFVADGVLTMRTALPRPRYDDPARRTEFYRQVLGEVRALPGVQSAAYTSGLPMVLTGGITGIALPGEEPRRGRTDGVSWRLVTSQYFRTLRLPLLRGRDIDETDLNDRPLVAVVSESFVSRYWPDQEPIGKTFSVRNQERTVVGVVADMKVRGLERTNEPQLYLPAAQSPDSIGDLYVPKDLLIRTTGTMATLLPSVRRIIRTADPEQPISDIRTMSEVVGSQTEDRRAQVRILATLATIAILLTGVGIHGLLAFMVAQRSREIGIRLALGAEPARVAGMIVREAARLAILGGVPGMLLAYAGARSMRALLFGVGPGDPGIVAAGVALVLLVTLAGSLVPAFSAVRVSPLTAMRGE